MPDDTLARTIALECGIGPLTWSAMDECERNYYRAEAEKLKGKQEIRMALPDELVEWISARCTIEDVEIGQTHHIARGKYVVGRTNASKIMKALTDAGFTVRYIGNEQSKPPAHSHTATCPAPCPQGPVTDPVAEETSAAES